MMPWIETFGIENLGLGIFILIGFIVGDNRFRIKKMEEVIFIKNPKLSEG